MSTSLSLSDQVPTDSLKTIASALPSSLADKVISSQVEQVFIWVIEDSDNASKIVSTLQDIGFKNIKIDSKGNTITAQARGLINSAPMEEPVSETAPETTTTSEPTSSTLDATAAGCSSPVNLAPYGCSASGIGESICDTYYQKCSGGGTKGCKWGGSSCTNSGCSYSCIS